MPGINEQSSNHSTISRVAGVTALSLAILLVVLPFGGYATPLVGVLALFSGQRGFVLGFSAVMLSFVNVLALSPIPYLAAKAGYYEGEWRTVLIWGGLLVWQISVGTILLAMARNKSGRFGKMKSKTLGE